MIDDLVAWKADLETRHQALKDEQVGLLAAKDTMEPAIAARALNALADRMEALELEWLAYAEEVRRGKE